ncbi:MAG: FAD-binding protein [Chloroflexi bacterium]|nr:FAD-binding protein [Chloroflexota bacterium]MBI4507260.1 FAD-binding protein [Chloroflexota bacterium]
MDRRELVRELVAVVGQDGVLASDYDLLLYQYDGSIDTARPDVVVLPRSAEQVAAIVRLAGVHGVPVVARGAGTGLSGGCIPVAGGILLGFARMNRIVEIDLPDLRAVVEPGVVNLHLSQAVAHERLQYVPDPSSQKACTIGGNVGENAGGPHTLAYGVTTNHVLGLELVTAEGEIVQVGGRALDGPGYDLTGLLVGSEGTLGVVTKIIVRLAPLPEAVKTLLAVFESVRKASEAVSRIIGAGVVPAALEMMDAVTLRAVEEATHFGYPMDAGAVLIIELEGLREAIEEQAEQVGALCREVGVLDLRVARDDRERALLWKGRKEAFGALGRLCPEYYVMDGVVPRSKLPEVLDEITAIAERYGLRLANVFHAGDGNLHPLLMFDSDDPTAEQRVREAGAEVLRVCAAVGGSPTGEHGIGVEKRDLMPLFFDDADIEAMKRLKAVFDPDERFNPGKIFPTPGACGELKPRSVSVASLAGGGW